MPYGDLRGFLADTDVIVPAVGILEEKVGKKLRKEIN